METLMKVCAAGTVCGVICAVLRRYSPEHAVLVSLLCCTAAVMAAVRLLEPVLQFWRELQELSGMESAVLSPLLKTAAIGLLTEVSSAFCQDAGEAALGKVVSLCGGILAMVCALPLGELVLELLRTMIGG